MNVVEEAAEIIAAVRDAYPRLSTDASSEEIAQALNDARIISKRHTADELMEQRMLYNAHAANGWLAAGIPVVKSWRHHTGEPCFDGGWFIVVATLPAGRVSNHYRADHWSLFSVPEVELAPAWDSSDTTANRLRASLLKEDRR